MDRSMGEKGKMTDISLIGCVFGRYHEEKNVILHKERRGQHLGKSSALLSNQIPKITSIKFVAMERIPQSSCLEYLTASITLRLERRSHRTLPHSYLPLSLSLSLSSFLSCPAPTQPATHPSIQNNSPHSYQTILLKKKRIYITNHCAPFHIQIPAKEFSRKTPHPKIVDFFAHFFVCLNSFSIPFYEYPASWCRVRAFPDL